MSSKVVLNPGPLRALTEEARRSGKRVGFVPTMGALHSGHLSLVRKAREQAGLVVVSVFVNPTQFGPGEDFDRYPRNLDADSAASFQAGADVVFSPPVEAVYPQGAVTEVHVGAPLTTGLCAAHRPGHFAGVATVVTKLFHMVGPCVAVFGRKDYQQLKVIERLARDLLFDVEVVGAPTVREPDGLALSSRNAYLSPEERESGLALARGLSAAWKVARNTTEPPRVGAIRNAAQRPIEAAMDSVDYVEACHPDTLVPLPDDAEAPSRLLVAAAAHIGATRLIDNVVIGEDPCPCGSDGGRRARGYGAVVKRTIV